MTSNNHTEVGRLSRGTNRSSTRTNRRQVVRNVDAEALPVLDGQTIAQSARVTEISVQEARVFVSKDFHHDRVDHNPTASFVNVLLVQKTAHTVDQHGRRDVSRRQSGSTRKTSSNRDGIANRTSGRDVTERGTRELHRSQQFVRTSSRDSTSTVDGRVHSVSVSMQSRLGIARQVAKNFLVVLVSQTISCTVRGEVHEVDVRMLLFNVIDFECEVVRLVHDQREVFVSQVLSLNLRTTSVRRNRDFRFLDDLHRVAHFSDFAKVVRVSDVAHNSRFTESRLDFLGINDRREVTVGKVRPTGSCLKSHDESPLK